MQVSVIFLVKDPPIDRLAALVEYLRPIADEFVVVVDTRTREDDIEVMSSWDGVKIVPFEWCDDFAAARNAALPHVTNPWTLHLDPDELPSIYAMAHIAEVTHPDKYTFPLAYIYWFKNWWGGVEGPEEDYHWHIRLWRTGRGKFYRPVHELVMLDGQQEPMTRGTVAAFAPKQAVIIHSKPADKVWSDQDYYETLGERSL